MTDCRTMDPFGRPERAALFGLSAAILIATISGSVWPPRARSVCPPFDTLAHGGDHISDHIRNGDPPTRRAGASRSGVGLLRQHRRRPRIGRTPARPIGLRR